MASEPKAASSRSKRSTTDTSAKTSPAKTVKKTAAAQGGVATAPKIAARKTVAKPATAAASAGTSAPKRKPRAAGKAISADARLRHIEVAAYYIAEASGFSRNPADCWLAAERQIDGQLLAGQG